MRQGFLLIPPLIFAAFACPAALAQLPPSTLSATSPSGRYTIAIMLPDASSKGSGWAPFVCTLSDATTGKPVWAREQTASREKGHPLAIPTELQPAWLFVTDGGEAIGLINTIGMFFVNLSRPAMAVQSQPIASLFRDPRSGENYGHGWTQGSLSVIPAELSLADGAPATSCLIVRAHWGEHLLLNARTLDLLAADNPAARQTFAPAAAAEALRRVKLFERQTAVATIAQAAHAPIADAGPSLRQQLNTAMQTAGLLNLRETIADLRSMEAAAAAAALAPIPPERRRQIDAAQRELNAEMDTGIAQAASFDPQRVTAAASKLQELQSASSIPLIHQTLRRLGEHPVAGVGVAVFSSRQPHPLGSREAQLNANLLPVQERLAGLASIKPGVQIWPMFYAIGCPDEQLPISSRQTAYLYHIDASDPYTLRVTVGPDRYTIESIQEVRPPLWQESAAPRTIVTHP